jgi:hypothetical protein
VATRALPPPPLRRVERARRAGAATWAWAREPGNRLAALIMSVLATASLGAIAAGIVLGGRYPGPDPQEPGVLPLGQGLLIGGLAPWVIVGVLVAILVMFWIQAAALCGLVLLVERILLRILPRRPERQATARPAGWPDPAGHYALLGVDPRSSLRLVRRSYRRLALRHHPDRGGDLRTMQALNHAWSILGDPERRAAYDRPGGGGP